MAEQTAVTIEKNGVGKAATPAVVKRGPVDLFEQIEQEMEAMRRQMFGLFPLRFFGRPGGIVTGCAFSATAGGA